MANMIYVLTMAGISIVALIAMFFLFSRVYKRATKDIAFVRTGAGGAKVVKDGGCLVFPVLHELKPVNMNTMKLNVTKRESEALISFDRMRVDVSADFYVRVKQEEKAIENAAQTLGLRTLDPDELKNLVEGKLVDALRSAAASMSMSDLHEKRTDFVQKVQESVESDLTKNGLELESVSLTSLDQTSKDFFNPNNAFDAEGLTGLTKQTEERRRQRNDIEQETRLLIADKNLTTERQELLIRQEAETARIEAEKQIAIRKAQQESEIMAYQAEQTRDAQLAAVKAERIAEEAKILKDRELLAVKIDAEKDAETRTIEKVKSLEQARIEQKRSLELAEQDKKIALAIKSEEEAAAQAKAEIARGLQVKASEDVITISEVAEAKRAQEIDLINAESLARKDSIKVTVKAEAESVAATKMAEATITLAKAEADAEAEKAKGAAARYNVEAEGQKMLNEAANLISPDIIAMNIQKALIEALPNIIRESVKPMEKIDSIRVVDMGGMTQMGNGGSASGEDGGGGSLADQVVKAGLKHRAYAPLMDEMLKSVGLVGGGNLNDMVQGLVNKNITLPATVVQQEIPTDTKSTVVVKESPEKTKQLELNLEGNQRKNRK